jgi:hypothetical protein
MKARLGLCAVLVALLAAAPATAAQRASLTTSTTTPKVGEAWRWTVTARDGTRALAARVRLQILLGGTVVGCWKGGAMAACAGAASGDAIPFVGKRTGVIRWPAQSVGVTLTFQAVVTAKGKTSRLRAPVTVKAAGGQ